MHNIDENEVLRDALSGLNEEVPPMPENLHAAWMHQIGETPISDSDCLQSPSVPSARTLGATRATKVEDTQMEKTRTVKTLTRWLSVAAAMVFVIGGTLLTKDTLSADSLANQAAYVENGSMKAAKNYDTYTSAVYDEAVEEEAAAMDYGTVITMTRGAGSTNGVITEATSEKKIIRTAGMTIKTQRYDEALAALENACLGRGGWIESTNENTNSYSGLRTAYLTLRVPQDSLDSFLEGTEGLGRVTSRSESAQDVTASYQDTQTRLNTQLALMERLQALINESGDLSDLLALESQIADTQYQIDSLQTSLNRTDRQVSYSTVSITLQEEKVAELTDTTVSFGERLLSAVQVGLESLVGFLGDMVVFLMAALPFIAIVVVAVIAVKLIKRRKK